MVGPDATFIEAMLEQARAAGARGEVPVCAVLVRRAGWFRGEPTAGVGRRNERVRGAAIVLAGDARYSLTRVLHPTKAAEKPLTLPRMDGAVEFKAACTLVVSSPIMPEVSKTDTGFMRAALEQAQAAGARGEIPVGAVIVADGEIVARAGNRTIADCDPSAHAEIVALREAAKAIGNHRLLGTTLYVTIEPCAMCAGAIVQARIARLVYGADDAKGGAVRSCFTMLDHPQLNHQVEVTPGLLAEDAVALLQNFFAGRR